MTYFRFFVDRPFLAAFENELLQQCDEKPPLLIRYDQNFGFLIRSVYLAHQANADTGGISVLYTTSKLIQTLKIASRFWFGSRLSAHKHLWISS